MGTAQSTWEQFQAGQEPRDVRHEVLTSWRRSRFSGVDPEYVEVPYVETDLDTHFARVAVPIMAGMAELLTGDSSCLALADASGSVIWRWVSEPMLRSTLDALSVSEGFNFGEEHVGTNGLGTALETGALAVVRGSEHYVQRFHDVTCVAAPVRHPVTRRTAGAVNVTCRAADTNSLLAVVVRKLVEEIQRGLYDAATGRERLLLAEFLAEQRRSAGPVAAIGDGVFITSPEAAALGLDGLDLWDRIRSWRGRVDHVGLTLPADLVADVRVVRDGGGPTGAVLRISGHTDVGRPARRGRDQAGRARALAAAGPLAVCGEAGAGKATLLDQAFAGAATIDAATHALNPVGWLRRLGRQAAEGPVVLRHAELLDVAAVRTVIALLEPVSPLRIGLTVTVAEDEAPAGAPKLLIDALGAAVLTAPALRRKPDRVAALAQTELRRRDPRRSFSADAVAALRRYDWPGNVTELVGAVRDAVREAEGPTIGVGDLSAEIRHAAERRALTPLERAEASVIAAVLREHAGNKSTAARALGISRTALYAKIRTYRI